MLLVLKHKTEEKSSKKYWRFREEFYLKNQILSQHFKEISPEEYLNTIFRNKQVFTLIRGSTDIEKGTVFRIGKEDLYKFMERNNIYMPYCDFKNNYYHSKTVQYIRAFVVDLDNIKPIHIEMLTRYILKNLPLLPSYIINSGHGIHIIYALDKPTKVKGLRWTLKTVNKAIQDKFIHFANLDRHPLMHPYRTAGFTTKIGTIATVFQVSRPYNIGEIINAFGVKKVKKKKRKKTDILHIPNGKRAFFEWVILRMFKNPPIPGRRHDSFFALGIISYKCKREVPFEEAQKAVDMILENMKAYKLLDGFSPEEAYKAFRKGYNPKATTVSWRYLCGKLAWEYRVNKRNYRKQEDHLRIAREIKKIKDQEKVKKLKEEAEELLKRYPNKSKNWVAKKLDISRQYLHKLLFKDVN